jgi:signal transduction histidine kinase
VATIALPDLPEAGEPQPVWFLAYPVAFLTHWTVLSVAVAVRLWNAGGGQPTVARRRMRLLSAAAATLTVAIVLAAVGVAGDSPLQLATQLLALGSAVAFLLALAPPWLVRAAWRRPEQARLQEAIGRLMGATTEAEVAEQSLLRALGDLTGLALDRTRLFAQERTARAALERADALKSSFVALAAHELRTPVAAVHGIAETLHRLGRDLSEDRRTELRRMLYTQTTRLRLLVDQLLDQGRILARASSW